MAKNFSSVELQFLGAAGTVTGSKTYLKIGKLNILIDCGLFQGSNSDEKLNRKVKLPVKPSELDAVILTHGHLDHSGYLPVLVKKGFKGTIYATPPTKDITEIILCDSAKIQEEETSAANSRKPENAKPVKALYKEKHVNRTMALFKTCSDNEWFEISESLKFCFHKSGHILGSAMVEVMADGQRFIFSGDVGQQTPLLLDSPEQIPEADYVILESTYGDKLHDDSVSPYQALQEVVNKTFEKGGVLVIPSFAVERAQEIILLLNTLMNEKNIPSIPVYLDSPMGTDVTELFQKYRNWHNLTDTECEDLTKNVHLIKNFEETLHVLDDDRPSRKIIIAGSGMITGGRVLYYLKHLISDEKNTILLVGYQAEGTRGYQLCNGAKKINIDDEEYDVKAEVCQISALSAHADQGDLLNWLSNIKESPKMVFLNHGEETAAEALKGKIKEKYNWAVKVAELNLTYHL